MIGFMLVVSAGADELVEKEVEHAGVRFRVVRVESKRIQLMWKDSAGQPLATFERVRQTIEKEGKRLRFIMNAGIFEPGLVPSGLHIEAEKEVRPLNLREGKGNFYLKPNGVFLIQGMGAAKVFNSELYPAVESPRLAIQSGPMLLMNGKRHPKFMKGSSSIKHRNGVGVDGMGRVVFAMTDKGQAVSFWDFAGLFLELGCRDALFLDGDISQMAVNPEGELKSNRFAAMFVVID